MGGGLIGHVLPGIAFLSLGLWHLFRHIKLYTLQKNSYIGIPWFPISKPRYLELFLIILASSISISMELFIDQEKHQPFDSDGTIPSDHLHNFEHSTISFSFIVYAAFAIILDKFRPNLAHYKLSLLLGAIAFSQQFFLFRVHSTNNNGLEGKYHFLLQIVVAISVATTLMGIGLPKSFLISYVRSLSILFQGAWLIAMGFLLWTPSLVPKGCFLHMEDGHPMVRCSSEEALHRAKALANLQFSWFTIGIAMFGVSSYLLVVDFYSQNVDYTLVGKDLEEAGEDSGNVESLKVHYVRK